MEKIGERERELGRQCKREKERVRQRPEGSLVCPEGAEATERLQSI